ncbi:winged helix-turn-helix domain-containing protein [Actinomyces gerencseriae]
MVVHPHRSCRKRQRLQALPGAGEADPGGPVAPPSEQGIAAEFWSTHDLAHWMHGRFDVEYASDSFYRSLLHMAGLSFHLPQEVDRRRADETGVEARMTQIRAEIARLTGKQEGQKEDGNEEPEEEERKEENNGDGVIVASADEVRIEHEAITRRTWCKKGAITRIGVDRKRQSQSRIGFLHEADGNVDLMRLDWQNTSNIVKALTDLTLRYPGKRIVVVWDNAG